MDRLRSAQLDAVLEVAHDISELSDFERFRSQLLGHVRRLIDCEIAAYNELDLERGHAEAIVDPPESLTEELGAAFAAHVHQNPILRYHARTPNAARLSDLINLRQLRRLDLYDLVYGPLGSEHQIAIAPRASNRLIGITASRGGRDFDDDELRLLDALRPFIAAAIANLEARRRIEATIAALGEASTAPAAILLVLPGPRIEPTDERAERWLSASAGTRISQVRALEDWAGAAQVANDALHGLAPNQRRWINHPAGPHRATYVPAAGARPAAILIEPAPNQPVHVSELQRLGLTRRQSEVLQLVKRGQTNETIARSLAISERTVAHHLERIYRRLDVTTRTAAVARAEELLAANRPSREAPAGITQDAG